MESLLHTWLCPSRSETRLRDFPGSQWLRHHASTAGARGSIPSWGTKILLVAQRRQKTEEKKKDKRWLSHSEDFLNPSSKVSAPGTPTCFTMLSVVCPLTVLTFYPLHIPPWQQEIQRGSLQLSVLRSLSFASKAVCRQQHPSPLCDFDVVHSLSHVGLSVTPWAVAHQAPLSMGFPRQEYWGELSSPSPGDLPNPGMEIASSLSPASQAHSLPAKPWGKTLCAFTCGDCSHEIKRRLLLGRKVMTNLNSIFKSRDITLPKRSVKSRLWFFLWSCMDVRVGLWRRLSAEELMLLNRGVGEDSWESLGLQGDPTSPFWRRSALGFLWKEWC